MSILCEICNKPTKKWYFPCRDPETGMMAEVEIICKDCHDKWSMCGCPHNVHKPVLMLRIKKEIVQLEKALLMLDSHSFSYGIVLRRIRYLEYLSGISDNYSSETRWFGIVIKSQGEIRDLV